MLPQPNFRVRLDELLVVIRIASHLPTPMNYGHIVTQEARSGFKRSED